MINWSGVLSTGLQTLAAFGGVAVVAGAVAKLVSDHASKQLLQAHKAELDQSLETHKAQLGEALETHKAALARETETHKLTLKRQELIYQRELEAADAFMAVWRIIYPQYRFPGMDWHDACEDVATSLGKVEEILEGYLEKHAAALDRFVREKLEHARSVASSEKFELINEDDSISNEATKAAEQVLDALREARDKILSDLRR